MEVDRITSPLEGEVETAGDSRASRVGGISEGEGLAKGGRSHTLLREHGSRGFPYGFPRTKMRSKEQNWNLTKSSNVHK